MNYYVKKIISFILTLLFVAVMNFVIFRIIPGDGAIAKMSIDATPEQIEQLRIEYGYDGNIASQFTRWLGGVIRGDFGRSTQYDPIPVSTLLTQRLPVTIWLAMLSLIIIVCVSIPLGLVAARHPGGRLDIITEWVTQLFMSIPSFVQGILITFIFGIVLKAFTPGGYVAPSEDFGRFLGFMIFPAMSVALPKIAMTVRYMKTSVKRELNEDYVRTAHAKGNPEHRVMWKHVAKNSVMPVITFIGLIVAEVMAGSIMIEQVFNLPGMGRLLVNSISNRDFNVVAAIVLYIATTVIIVNFIVDILYRIVDPRLD